MPTDEGPRYDPTAERFFPKGDFPQTGPEHLASEEVDPGRSWYDAVPPQPRTGSSGRSPRASAAARPPAAGESPAADKAPAAGAAPGAGAGAGSGELPGMGVVSGVGESAAEGGADGASGPELARAVLDAALAKRRTAATSRRHGSGGAQGSGRRLRGYSGPGPDPRDPQLLGAMLDRLMKARGWEKSKAEATVFGAWEKVVGPDIAKHSRPVKLDAGVLTVEAESTAWATQLRLLAASLLRSIAMEVGHNVVTKLNIHGPAAPSWSRGLRRVQGRGPRDTYG